jgi:hypothetical protein
MYRHDVVAMYVTEIGNDMNNAFHLRWKDAEAAGEVSEAEEFVKPFVKAASKDMLKVGWTKNPLKDVIMENADLGADDKAIFKLHMYGCINDNRSYALSSYIEDGQFKEKVRSLCFEEVAKTFRKQELIVKPTQIAQ